MALSWTKTSDTQWTRRPGEIETAIKLIELSKASLGVSEISLTTSVTLTLNGQPLDATATDVLRRAWTRLRFEQPSLASTFTDLEKVVYEVSSAAHAVDQWLSATFHVEPHLDNVEAFNRQIQPSDYVTLHVLPRSSQLVLWSAHWRSDIIGTTMLMRRLLDLVAQEDLSEPMALSWGDEVSRLAPPAEEAANMKTEATPEEMDRIKQRAQGTLKQEPALCIKTLAGPSDAQPKDVQRLRWTFSKEETSQIVDACRSKKVSVTTAIHSALAVCNRAQARDADKQLPFRCTIRSNIRSYMPPPFNGPEYACTPIHAATSVLLDADASYEQGLHVLQENYAKGYDMFDVHRVFYRYILDLIFSGAVTKIAESADVDISSLGIVEKYLPAAYEGQRQLTVDDFTGSSNIYSTQNYFFVWTFREQLNFYVTYNDAFYTTEQMQQFMDKTRDLVLAALCAKA